MVIPFSEIKGVQVGNAWDDKAKTGVTVFYFPSPATAAVKIFGGGPASRETPLLEPERNSLPLNALVFGGGSAYGLAAADGVMRRMEEIGADSDKVPAEINAVGTLAARVMEAAIVDAVRSSSVSESEYLSNI